MLADQLVVKAVVIGGQQDAVVCGQRFGSQRHAGQFEMMLAHFREHRYVRVAVADVGAQIAQFFHQEHRRAFTHVVDVLLVGDTQHHDLAAVDRLLALVQCCGIGSAQMNSMGALPECWRMTTADQNQCRMFTRARQQGLQ